MIGIPAAAQMDTTGIPGGVRYYVNIESEHTSERVEKKYEPILTFLRTKCPMPSDLDVWRWGSSWRERPKYDQDQRRLDPICVARNMARAYMLASGASHLCFIDADVIVPPDALQRLLALGHPLVGGAVPGRGAHSHVWYVFGNQRRIQGWPPEIVEVDRHGTLGCSLIERELLSTLSFRAGLSREDKRTKLSEDPAFASDAYLNGYGRWWIHKGVICQHWDDPQNPFTGNQQSDDYDIPA